MNPAQQQHVAVRSIGGIADPAPDLANLARDNGALRAQLCGTFIIEEMIEQDEPETQVGESPDRGLDAQTPSGLE
jgi:hypothetical protein